MNNTNKILALVLLVQLVLLGVIALWPESESAATGEPLVAGLDAASITKLVIKESDELEITLTKNDSGNWVLPDYDDFPVDATRVTRLLDKIAALQTNRLITRSDTSHRRLQVAGDQFVRLVEFEQSDGKSHKLYLGNTGGGGAIYARLDDQDQVYLVDDLASSDAPSQPSGWINTLYLSAAQDQVTAVTLTNANGTFEFTKSGDTWTMAGLAENETLNQEALNTLLGQITALRMTAPIGKETEESFGLDAPRATLKLKVLEAVGEQTEDPAALNTPTATPQMEERDYTLQIGAELEDGVVVKSSASDYYVLVSTTTASNLLDKTRENFITVLEPTATPEPSLDLTPQISTPDAEDTPAATEEPGS